MKKILLITLLLINFFNASASTQLSSYRWRNDDGTETTATWKAPINTPIEINNLDPVRIRMLIENYSSSNKIIPSTLEFSIEGSNIWTNVTDSSSPFSFASTANAIHESTTTQQIATNNTAPFLGGYFISDNSSTSVNLAATGNFTELEFSIKLKALSSTSIKYLFRVPIQNGFYSSTPELTYSCGTAEPTASSPQNFNSSDKVSDLAATGTDLKWYTSVAGGTVLDVTTPLSTGLYYVSQTLSSCESTRTQVQVNINGAALNFSVGGYVDLPISMPASYTKEAWINVRDFSQVNNIISGGDNDGTHAVYIPGGILSAGHNGSYETLKDSQQLDINTWYHVAVTYDLATTTMKLYKNGVVIDEKNNILPFTGSVVRIGAFEANNNLFNGVIDEARIWNKVLTQAEIQEKMSCEFAGAQPGLIAYYKFNQGFEGADNSAITSLTDSSGNGNDGTLIKFYQPTSTSNWITNSIIQSGKTCTTLNVGDHELEFNSSLKVYPNPSNSAFFINSDSNGTIVLFDLLGKVIQTQKLNSGTTTLDLGSTPNGIYLLKVTNEKNQSKTVKLIKN